MCQDWCSYQFGLQLKEGSGTIFHPLKPHPFLCQLVEWPCYLRKPIYESTIIATKPKERTYFFHICWHWPVSDAFCFLWVCTDTFLGHYMSKKFHSLGKQLALPDFKFQTSSLQPCKNIIQIFYHVVKCFPTHYYIIQVY